jgi:CSLREA domain-containing protein
MKRSLRRTLDAALVLATLAASTTAAGAAVYIPTKTADTADGACDADCSLREAVLAANAHAGDDVILLRAGTFTLTRLGDEDLAAAGDLDVQDDLVILGDGAGRSIIDGGGFDRIFQVPAGVTAEIRDVTLRRGTAPAGGAILNAGELTILRSALTGNSSGAGGGGAGFGGAILTDGLGSSLTVRDSLVAGNIAHGGGGGIAIGGDATLANVTIVDNESRADFGGGLYVFSDARATVNNATIAGNRAALKGGGVLAENSAFIGISPKITNSILAGNTASSEPDCSGPVDSGHDLIGVGAGCVGPSAAKNDIVGALLGPIDAKTGPLGQNGGPTSTRALLAGSPAINAGNPAAPGSGPGACEATDQRGAARPGGTRCDIGAFEITQACVAGGGTLCLNNGRFQVTAAWQTGGTANPAQGVTLTGESGYFYFFDPGNVEVTVKVLNACTANNRFWVFAAGMTNVRVELTVTDTQTGAVKTYVNPQNRTFRTILDTGAFATCP